MDSFDFDKNFKRMWIAIIVFLVVVFILVVGGWIVTGIVVYKAGNEVQQHGLHGAVKQLWCGKDSKCDLPTLPENKTNKQ